MDKISIQPGELYLTRQPALLQTILGSCVGLTFWCARLGVGALCHGVLPRSPAGAIVPEGFRYVDFSIRYLADAFDGLGASREELEIKLFGGADVLTSIAADGRRPTVGSLNCQTAWEVLGHEGFRTRASDLGGKRGRTICFNTATGEVLVFRHAILPAAGRSNAALHSLHHEPRQGIG